MCKGSEKLKFTVSVTHTHARPFKSPLSGTTWVSRYQKGKTNLDLLKSEARDSEWQWHQLGRMQVCTSLQTDNHSSTQPLSFLQPFLPPNQQHQSTVGLGLVLVELQLGFRVSIGARINCCSISVTVGRCQCSFSALTLLVGRQEGHPACKKTEWWNAICLE